MADILIRGMEMPTQNALLHIRADGRALLYPFCVLDKVTEYEAVELPPHGDLIDKDAMLTTFTERADKEGWGWIDGEDIIDAPVIIPANKEGQ